jgi:hypothetical protein
MGSVSQQQGGERAALPSAGAIALAALTKLPPESRPAPVHVETSIGRLVLLQQRFEDIGAFSKLPFDESSSTRLRLYLPCIAARSDALGENGDGPRIDEASTRQLTDEELERIAEAYLLLPERQQVAEGAGAPSSPIVRAEGESATGYLDRLLKADHERQMENLQGTYESLSHPSTQPLSSALAAVDRQASSLRDAATRSMREQDIAAPDRRSGLVPNAIADLPEGDHLPASADAALTDIDAPPHAHNDEIALTRSIGTVSAQSAILVASLSEVSTRFLREFSEAAQKSEEAARAALRTVRITALITAALAAIAAAAAIVSYLDARESRQATNQWQESTLQSMKETAAAQAAQIKSLDDKVRELSDRPSGPAATPPSAPTSAASAAPVSDSAAPKGTADADPASAGSTKAASTKRTGKRKTSH